MFLEELVNGVEFENNRIECKSILNREDVVGWLKSIAGFANASGGEFYIGVEDKTNKLIGFERNEIDRERNYFNCSASDHFTLVLPDLTHERGVADDDSPVIIFAPAENGTPLDERVLSFCYYKSRKVSDIANYLEVSDSTYLRRHVLDNLDNQGYLLKSKQGRAQYYKTNPAMVSLA